jgi:hypothetical protein
MSRNPIARSLRSPNLRARVIPDARLMAGLDRFRARQDALLKALDDDDDAAFDRIEADMKAQADAADTDADWRWANDYD